MGDTKDGSWTSRELGAYLQKEALKSEARSDKLLARDKAEVADAVGVAIYTRMTRLAIYERQIVKCDSRLNGNYFVTLEQLESAFIKLRDELRAVPQTEEKPK